MCSGMGERESRRVSLDFVVSFNLFDFIFFFTPVVGGNSQQNQWESVGRHQSLNPTELVINCLHLKPFGPQTLGVCVCECVCTSSCTHKLEGTLLNNVSSVFSLCSHSRLYGLECFAVLFFSFHCLEMAVSVQKCAAWHVFFFFSSCLRFDSSRY